MEGDGRGDRQSDAIQGMLRQSDERFRRVVEHAPNAMVLVNRFGMIEMINAQAERVFGYTRRELLGEPIEILVPERLRGHHPDHREAFYADPRSRPMGAGRDLFGLRKDGSEFPVEIGLNPIETDDGMMVLSAIVDISERQQREDSLRKALDEKNTMFREVHHRVKNNLQVISSLLDLQMNKVSDPGVLEILRESRNRVRSMSLVHQQLYQSGDFTSIDFGSYLQTLATTVAAAYESRAARVTLAITAAPVALPIETAIPCGLIVNELVSNALKHGFPDDRPGRIDVTFDRDSDGTVSLSVADDGVGLAPGIAVDEPETLGLQLVTLLTDQIGGSLSLNRAGPTRFTVRFGAGRPGE